MHGHMKLHLLFIYLLMARIMVADWQNKCYDGV